MLRLPRRFYLIRQLERASYQMLEPALRGDGLTPTQYMILSLSARSAEPLSSAELARRARISAQAMNESITSLEAKGLIERPQGGKGRRALPISLTQRGWKLLTIDESKVDAIEEQFFSSLSEGENLLLRELLMRVVRSLRHNGRAELPSDRQGREDEITQ
jgi:DNA-binding MarR family transcriptional regulator